MLKYLSLCCILSKFYIKPQHAAQQAENVIRCILSKFYIKPQPNRRSRDCSLVVSYRNSTSNHNLPADYVTTAVVVSYRNSTSNHNSTIPQLAIASLYLIEILHQTTTIVPDEELVAELYLIEILHQTTTVQPASNAFVALYLIEILHQTTTWDCLPKRGKWLYLIEILHQTTTRKGIIEAYLGCILSKFYIKPQLASQSNWPILVVSYRNSTSNHNANRMHTAIEWLYLIEILHQTTTLALE